MVNPKLLKKHFDFISHKYSFATNPAVGERISEFLTDASEGRSTVSALTWRQSNQAVSRISTTRAHAATKKLRIVRDFGWEIAHEAVSRRPPISLSRFVARTHMYTYAAKVWVSSIVQGPFCCRPVLTLELRFATFSSQ
jgi:hypothetical protein